MISYILKYVLLSVECRSSTLKIIVSGQEFMLELLLHLGLQFMMCKSLTFDVASAAEIKYIIKVGPVQVLLKTVCHFLLISVGVGFSPVMELFTVFPRSITISHFFLYIKPK